MQAKTAGFILLFKDKGLFLYRVHILYLSRYYNNILFNFNFNSNLINFNTNFINTLTTFFLKLCTLWTFSRLKITMGNSYNSLY